MLSGSTVYRGRSLKGGISQHPIPPISPSHLRPCIPVHTLTVCIYSTSSIYSHRCGLTSCVLRLSDGAKLVLCQYSLPLPKNVSGMKRGKSYTAPDSSAPLLHNARYFSCRLASLICHPSHDSKINCNTLPTSPKVYKEFKLICFYYYY